MKILFKIILSIIWLGTRLFALAVLLYFIMLFYLGFKDGTIYKYKEFQCKNKEFINTIPVSLSLSNYSNIVTLDLNTNNDSVKIYSINNKFKFLSLYSLYDFEGGTFYKYLIEDQQGIKSFVRFDDIDPKKCTFDTADKYWFKNNKEYLPVGNKIKISKTTRDQVFDSNKGKL
jgi:hypothetical protein